MYRKLYKSTRTEKAEKRSQIHTELETMELLLTYLQMEKPLKKQKSFLPMIFQNFASISNWIIKVCEMDDDTYNLTLSCEVLER